MKNVRLCTMSVRLVLGLLLCTASASRATVYYVDGTNGNDSADGLSWSQAFASLTNALAKAGAGGDEIRVAQGTYKPAAASETDRTKTFTMKANLKLYGGFTNGMAFADRDWKKYVTTLSGEIGGAGMEDNCYHVMQCTVLGCTIDGFTFTRGAADGGASPQYYGGGLYNSSTPTVRNCAFVDNLAGEGGGIALCGGSPLITNCTFTGNVGLWGGGGIWTINAVPTVISCLFSNNSATTSSYGGGAVANYNSSIRILNCTFVTNTAPTLTGGAIYSWQATPTVSNCTFIGNTATYGGAMHNRNAPNARVVSCTFTANKATLAGGAVYLDLLAQNTTIKNCILWGDSAPTGPEIRIIAGSVSNSFSDIQGCGGSGGGWQSSCGSDGGGNIDADPLFVDAASHDVHLKSAGGHWTPGGWVLDAVTSPCIDKGDPSDDRSKEPTPNGGRINMGAYGNTAEASKTLLPRGTLIMLI